MQFHLSSVAVNMCAIPASTPFSQVRMQDGDYLLASHVL